MIEIAWKDIEPQTLERLLEEVVSREGTDYGQNEISLKGKVDRLLRQLKDGRARLYWNSETHTASVLSDQEGKLRQRQPAKRPSSEQ